MQLQLNVELREELMMEKMFSIKGVSYRSWQRRDRKEGNVPEGKVILWRQWYQPAVTWWGWYHGGGGTVVAVVLQGRWYNTLSRRGMLAETQKVEKV